MKTRLNSFIPLFLSFAIVLSSCQQDDITATDYISEASLHSDDQSRFSSETDAVAYDINTVLELEPGFAGRSADIQTLVCDASILIDTVSNPRTITITYNGINCAGSRSRTGAVIISMPSGIRWRNAGAALTVNFQNLKITRLADNKSITINGVQTHTNLSGGLLVNLAGAGTITHTITSTNMSVTFDNGSQRTWQVARQRVFTYNNGIVINSTGTHFQNGQAGIAEWGVNRFGNNFTTVISQPMVIRQDCGFRLVGGKLAHETSLFNATVLFGLDAAGNPTTCPGTGLYYFRINWTGPSGLVRTVILPY